jgi:hypothetical protein
VRYAGDPQIDGSFPRDRQIETAKRIFGKGLCWARINNTLLAGPSLHRSRNPTQQTLRVDEFGPRYRKGNASCCWGVSFLPPSKIEFKPVLSELLE